MDGFVVASIDDSVILTESGSYATEQGEATRFGGMRRKRITMFHTETGDAAFGGQK